MKFSDLIGQKTVIQSLQNSISNQKIGHAYIFEGPEGIGKKTVAAIFAAALTCDDQSIEPCGNCRSCIKNEAGNHPDIKIINGAGESIGIDAVRELKKDIYIKPYEAGKKIYIIQEAQSMTVQAQNSLLKVLEEPPSYGMIILTTTNASLLLSTIRSRSILIRFRTHTYHEIEKFLTDEYPMLSEEKAFLAAFSGGVIGRAKTIAVSEEFKSVRERMADILMSLVDSSELNVIESVDYFVEHKDHAQVMLDIMVMWFRDVLFIKEIQDDSKLINLDWKNKLHRFSQRIKRDRVVRIIELLTDTKKKISMNINFALAIETMLIQSWEEAHDRGSRSAV